MVTLGVTVLGSVLFRGFLGVIPVLIGVVAGYGAALAAGIVDLSAVAAAPWIEVPTLYAPAFSPQAILMILPAGLVVLAEHVGHLVVTGNVVGRDFVKDPGLHRSLLGDGISNDLGLAGATPNTTYGENIGVLAITRVFSTWVIGGAAVLAVVISFVGKLAAAIRSIPTPVMGGVCILLFGVIAAAGVRMLVEKRVDYTKPRNLSYFVVLVSGAQRRRREARRGGAEGDGPRHLRRRRALAPPRRVRPARVDERRGGGRTRRGALRPGSPPAPHRPASRAASARARRRGAEAPRRRGAAPRCPSGPRRRRGSALRGRPP